MSLDLFSTAQLTSSMVPYLHAIGWALIHFLWQGVLVAGVAAFLLMLTNNAKPQTRYAIACIALLICAILPLWELLHTDISSQSDTAMVVAQTAFEHSTSNVNLSMRQQLELWLQGHLLQLVAGWLVIVSLLIGRLLLGLWWLQSYYQGQRGIAHVALQRQIDLLSQRFLLAKQVVLRVVDDLESPITIGSLRPMVLVPASLVTGMSPAHLEALLAHELAHISRHDYFFNLMQNLIESFLFFHPAVWWISKKIRNERENIADDLAASVLGEPRRLALALQELDHIRFTTPQLAQAAHGGHLMSRIKRLVRPEINSMNWKTAVTLIATTIAGFTLAANAAVHITPSKPVAPIEVAEPIAAKQDGDPVVLDDVKRKEKWKRVVPARISFERNGCKPEYPRAALRSELQGTTSVAVTVAPSGSVSVVKVIKSSGHEILDEAVRIALLNPSCKMQAGTLGGEPTKETREVKYVWKLDGEPPAKKIVPALVKEQNMAARIDFELPECKPAYPRASLRNLEEGTTHISFQVAENGAISDVKIVASSGFRGLDEALRTQLQLGQCKAQPAMQEGIAVASNTNFQYVWKLD